jgi:phage tail-like protein
MRGNLTGAQRVSIPDPIPSFKFHVEIEGIVEGMFSECSGLKIKREVIQYKEGGVNHTIHQFPDRISYSNLKLTRGSGSPELFNWFMQGAQDGKVKYLNLSILLYGYTDQGLEIVQRWNLERAFPVSWIAPTLQAGSKTVAIEALEISFQSMTVTR